MIPDGWIETKLGEVVEIASSKRIYADEYLASGIPFYRGKEIIEKYNGNNVSTELFISKVKFNEIKERFGVPKPGDILLTSVGTLGIPYIVQENEDFYFKDGNLTWFKHYNGIDNKFLFYWFISDFGKEQLMKNTIGSTQQALTIVALNSLPILLPPLSEQKEIADILSSLDDKIELLREENKTLEAIAQTIFKEWFVNFNFPDENGKPYKSSGGKVIDSELGEIPEGWRVGKLGEFGKIVCGKTPSKEKQDFFGGEIPFIKIPDMHNQIFISETEDSLTDLGASTQINKFIPKDSICISCIATVGLVSITSKKSQTNQQINTIVPSNQNYLEYLYFTLKIMKDDLLAIGSGGSATMNINTGIFSNISVLVAEKNIYEQYSNKAASSFMKIKLNISQIQTLSTLRDSFLLKLMNGQIRVEGFNN